MRRVPHGVQQRTSHADDSASGDDRASTGQAGHQSGAVRGSESRGLNGGEPGAVGGRQASREPRGEPGRQSGGQSARGREPRGHTADDADGHRHARIHALEQCVQRR
jgi:hypothetical protein